MIVAIRIHHQHAAFQCAGRLIRRADRSLGSKRALSKAGRSAANGAFPGFFPARNL